jgi:molecular chaperone GrpE
MADEMRDTGDAGEVALDLDEQTPDLETAMREAVAAVEEVEGGARTDAEPGDDADEVSRLRREIADLRDRSMRTLADFDNFRKRSERERQDLRRYALLEPMRELLTVADNLDLALSAQGSAEDLKRGVEMIHRQMQELMRRFGVSEIAAVGKPFDPTQHEAVSREESAEVQAPTVVAELRRGYRMHDRLLRPSMVKVAVPPEDAPSAAAGGGEEPAL